MLKVKTKNRQCVEKRKFLFPAESALKKTPVHFIEHLEQMTWQTKASDGRRKHPGKM